MEDDTYNINKVDTKIMLHWLRLNVPNMVTPEAIWLLVQRKAHLENLESLTPEVVDQMLKDRQVN